MLQIVAREQNLGHGVVVFAKQLVVGVHQFALAHGGCGLLAGHIGGAGGQPQLAHTHANGTAGDQQNLMAGVF